MRALKQLLARLRDATEGSVAVIFGLALIPVMISVGAAVDYSRANAVKSFLQGSIDAAVMAAAKDGSSSWNAVALNTLNGNLAAKNISTAAPVFTRNSDDTYSGSITATVPTSVLGVIHIPSINVGVSAVAANDPDNACILTLDAGQASSHVSMQFNGAPVVNLSGCTIRSNTSIDCNGHDGNSTKTIAAGTVTGCAHPKSNAGTVPDIYASLASNIIPKCGSLRVGITWVPGSTPVGAGIITVNMGAYVEHHICGDLTLSGSGYLTGTAPTSDTVVVVENGSINLANNADIHTVRTTLVLTGNNNFSSQINFPNGNGKAATLSLSPSTSPSNPWRGVALYQDPSLTKDVDNTWGPGAALNADGLVYLPKSNVVTNGNTDSNNSQCTKFVLNRLRTNGSVNLNFTQSTNNCEALGLKQWSGASVRLTR
jgi:Flp pilus assembly protein TadG